MSITRGVRKLRRCLSRRGVALPAVALSALLPAAPAGLAGAASAAAMGGAAAKVKIAAVAGVLVALGIGVEISLPPPAEGPAAAVLPDFSAPRPRRVALELPQELPELPEAGFVERGLPLFPAAPAPAAPSARSRLIRTGLPDLPPPRIELPPRGRVALPFPQPPGLPDLPRLDPRAEVAAAESRVVEALRAARPPVPPVDPFLAAARTRVEAARGQGSESLRRAQSAVDLAAAAPAQVLQGLASLDALLQLAQQLAGGW
jgi:hypothetical protein